MLQCDGVAEPAGVDRGPLGTEGPPVGPRQGAPAAGPAGRGRPREAHAGPPRTAGSQPRHPRRGKRPLTSSCTLHP